MWHTFNLRIGGLFGISYVNHQESVCRLIETHHKVLEIVFFQPHAHAPIRLHKAAFVEKHINSQLIRIGSIRLGEVIDNGLVEFLSSSESTDPTLRGKSIAEDHTIPVNESDDSVPLENEIINTRQCQRPTNLPLVCSPTAPSPF